MEDLFIVLRLLLRVRVRLGFVARKAGLLTFWNQPKIPMLLWDIRRGRMKERNECEVVGLGKDECTGERVTCSWTPKALTRSRSTTATLITSRNRETALVWLTVLPS